MSTTDDCEYHQVARALLNVRFEDMMYNGRVPKAKWHNNTRYEMRLIYQVRDGNIQFLQFKNRARILVQNSNE